MPWACGTLRTLRWFSASWWRCPGTSCPPRSRRPTKTRNRSQPRGGLVSCSQSLKPPKKIPTYGNLRWLSLSEPQGIWVEYGCSGKMGAASQWFRLGSPTEPSKPSQVLSFFCQKRGDNRSPSEVELRTWAQDTFFFPPQTEPSLGCAWVPFALWLFGNRSLDFKLVETGWIFYTNKSNTLCTEDSS